MPLLPPSQTIRPRIKGTSSKLTVTASLTQIKVEHIVVDKWSKVPEVDLVAQFCSGDHDHDGHSSHSSQHSLEEPESSDDVTSNKTSSAPAANRDGVYSDVMLEPTSVAVLVEQKSI